MLSKQSLSVNTRRIVILGTLASNPYAGMAWMHMQIAAGLRRLGHDVYYVEATSVWPYDPIRRMKVNNSDYAVPYLAKVAESLGLVTAGLIAAASRTRSGLDRGIGRPRTFLHTQMLYSI